MEAPTKLVGLIGGSLGVLVALYEAIGFTHDRIRKVDELEQRLERQNEEVKQVRGNLIIDEIKSEILHLREQTFRVEDVYGEKIATAPGLVREGYKRDKIELDSLQQELRATQRAYKALR